MTSPTAIMNAREHLRTSVKDIDVFLLDEICAAALAANPPMSKSALMNAREYLRACARGNDLLALDEICNAALAATPRLVIATVTETWHELIDSQRVLADAGEALASFLEEAHPDLTGSAVRTRIRKLEIAVKTATLDAQLAREAHSSAIRVLQNLEETP